MLVRNLVSFEKFSILTKVGFEYQHSLSHHLLNLRKRFIVFKTDQTNGLSITIIISGANFKMCLGMRHTVCLDLLRILKRKKIVFLVEHVSKIRLPLSVLCHNGFCAIKRFFTNRLRYICLSGFKTGKLVFAVNIADIGLLLRRMNS